MYPDELERLISLTLVDGRVTDKERTVLVRKAVSLGIDPDEFEVVLDARIHEASEKATPPPAAEAPSQSNKVGGIRKCPACGATVRGLTARCEECDHEFTDAGASSSIHELLGKLEALGAPKDAAKSVGEYFGRLFGEDHPATVRGRRASLIRNHVLPNTKAGILEFLALGVPRARVDKGTGDSKWPRTLMPGLLNLDEIERAWKDKCCEAVHKGRMLFSDDQATLRQIEVLAKEIGM